MVAALSLVYLHEELDSFVLIDVALVYARDAALVELIVDDRVSFRSALDLPSQEFVLWELIVGEAGDERLHPGRYLSDGEGALDRWLRSPRVWS
jgi:hypothetical protein